MKYFKIAFLAAIGWNTGAVASKLTLQIISKGLKKADEYLTKCDATGIVTEEPRDNGCEFTVKGFCRN